MAQGVLDVVKTRYWSFIPRTRLAAGASTARSAPTSCRARSPRAATASRSARDELTALFAEDRPEAIEDLRQAADELRAELAGETVTFVVNRNINVSNICTVGCAFCGFGQGAARPTPTSTPRTTSAGASREAVDFGATEICMQSGIHPDWGLEDYEHWLRRREGRGADLTCTRTRRWRSRTWSTSPACRRATSSPGCATPGSDSTPGTAAEILDDGVRERISPNKLPAARWVEIIEASHAAGLRSTSTVMFGHIEEPWELAEHMRVVRELQERTGGITEFVPLSFVPFQTLLGRTHGIEPIGRDENLKHTAVFRLALGPHHPERPGQLGEDGPRGRDRVAALGCQRPRRHADGGVDHPDGRRRARRAPRPAAAHRRRARGRPARRRAHHARSRSALRHPVEAAVA